MKVIIPQTRSVFGGSYFAGLETTLLAARESGNEPVVLEASDCPAVVEFRRYFKPTKFPTSPELMHWWFEQWLLIEQWMRQTNTRVAFKIDSDVLVFDNLDQAWESLEYPGASAPTASSFVTQETAALYRDYILKIFREETAEELCEPGAVLGDDGILQPFVRGLGYPDLNHHPYLYVDSNLYLSQSEGETLWQGHKDIWFINGKPIYRSQDTARRCVSLHCWGEAKTRLHDIWAQSQLSKSGPPVRLTL